VALDLVIGAIAVADGKVSSKRSFCPSFIYQQNARFHLMAVHVFLHSLMPGIVIAQSGLARSVATGRIRPSLLVHIFKRQEYDMRTGTLQ